MRDVCNKRNPKKNYKLGQERSMVINPEEKITPFSLKLNRTREEREKKKGNEIQTKQKKSVRKSEQK